MQPVLLISYTFPPAPGIGGRRWAKFAKYLSQRNIEVKVISAKFSGEEISVWDKDVHTEKIQNVSVPDNYPSILSKVPISIWDKLSYRLALKKVEKRSKGSLYDKAIFAEKEILENAARLIEENGIRQVICTGAPFSVLYYGTLLKKKYPHLKLISDIRDPWTWGLAYGFGGISEDRMKHEKDLEKQVVELSDVITVPVEPMQKHLQKSYPAFAGKIKLLPHGIDRDDLPPKASSVTQIKTPVKTLVYSGTIYPGAEKMIDDLISHLQQKNHRISLSVYALSKKESLKARYAGTMVEIKDTLPPDRLFNAILQNEYYISFVTDQYKDFVSTKYYEIFYLKKPIILVSPNGVLSDFIVSNRLGVHFEPHEIGELAKFIMDPVDISYNADFKVEDYMFENLTGAVLDYLNQ